jgi:hypothetical protein
MAEQAPSFKTTLLRVHPEWITDLQNRFKDLEVSELRRIATNYSGLLQDLGLSIPQTTEGG